MKSLSIYFYLFIIDWTYLQVQQCIGAAVVAMGPAKLLTLLPITLYTESHSCTNAWLIPILRKHIVGASLEYYVDHIVPLAKSLMLASKEGTLLYVDSENFYLH